MSPWSFVHRWITSRSRPCTQMADATIAPTATGGLTLLEPAKPLRESLLWKLQAAFYAAQGMNAWASAVVPSFVTSNTFIAAAYAKVIIGFLRDWFLRCARDQHPWHPLARRSSF